MSGQGGTAAATAEKGGTVDQDEGADRPMRADARRNYERLVQAAKQEALSAHHSQQQWLESSQGMNSYLSAMTEMSRELGRLSGRFQHAEGWRRRLHLGFSARDDDPLAAALGVNYLVNQDYERGLDGEG